MYTTVSKPSDVTEEDIFITALELLIDAGNSGDRKLIQEAWKNYDIARAAYHEWIAEGRP